MFNNIEDEFGDKFKIAKLAYEIAQKKHSGQKYGLHEYTYHLLKVKEQIDCFSLWYNDIEFEYFYVLAFLHDIFEDTDYTKEDLIKDFSVFEPVILVEELYRDLMTLTTPKGVSRANRDYSSLKTNFYASICKIADRIANIEECIRNNDKNKFRMYLKEREKLESCLYSDSFLDPFLNYADIIYFNGQVKFGLL